MKIGEDSISLRLGSDEVTKAYLGSELVYEQYIQDGLVFYLDGADATTSQWVDRKGGIAFAMNNVTLDGNGGVVFNGTNAYGIYAAADTLGFSATTHTIEVVANIGGTATALVFMQNTGSGAVLGITANGKLIGTSGYSEGEPNPRQVLNVIRGLMTCTFAGNTAYKNKVPLTVSTDPSAYFTIKENAGVFVGARDTTRSFLQGTIYQIRVYDRILSRSEILYNQDIDMRRYMSLTADDKMSLLMSRSFIADNPTILYDGNERWTYRGGLLLRGVLGVYDAYSNDKDVSDLLAYAKKYYHDCVNSGGIVGGAWGSYAKNNFDSDQVQAAFNLFRLKQLDNDQAYAANGGYYDNVISTLIDQLADQPRLVEPTSVSGTAGHPFQHKANYAYQHWLDGDFMVEPFRALYAHDRLSGQSQADMYDDIVEQLINTSALTYDTGTQLYRHAYAGQGSSASWSENGANTPGRSYFAWGRALGWYILAINEVLDIIPSTHNPTRRADLINILSGLLTRLLTYRDTSGVWALLPTLAVDTTNNKLEATSSCMYAYGYLHGVRMGYLSADLRDTALSVYQAVVRNFVTAVGASVTLNNCITGGNPGASSTNETDVLNNYYGKSWAANDEHGVGPFIMASLEYELLTTTAQS